MSQRQSTLIALLVAVTFFMENLDATVIATALPQMAKTFGVAAVDLNIGMSAYMLAIAAFIPISGWLADRLGSRLVFAGGSAPRWRPAPGYPAANSGRRSTARRRG